MQSLRTQGLVGLNSRKTDRQKRFKCAGLGVKILEKCTCTRFFKILVEN